MENGQLTVDNEKTREARYGVHMEWRKNCAHCGSEFVSQFECSRFCSQDCAERAYKQVTALQRYSDQDQRWLLPFRRPPAVLVAKNPKVWERAKFEWRDFYPQNLYLWGDEGTGKTSLACWLLCQRVEEGYSVRQVTCLDIELHLKYAFNSESRPKQVINELCNVSCLLIDDLSAPEWTPRGLSLLRYVLDRRHAPGRECETFCTSNLDPGDLSAMVDRVAGKGAGVQTLRRLQPVVTVNMVGTSYRMELAGAVSH